MKCAAAAAGNVVLHVDMTAHSFSICTLLCYLSEYFYRRASYKIIQPVVQIVHLTVELYYN